MKELIGATIRKIFVDDEQHFLVFETDHGDIVYETYGDCCSESWFADIVGVKDLLGQTVKHVEEVKMESFNDGRTRQSHDEFYGVKLKTARGITDIIYRNSSNGYYGGGIMCVKDFVRPNGLREISADWQA